VDEILGMLDNFENLLINQAKTLQQITGNQVSA
jgi:hypothetical protein